MKTLMIALTMAGLMAASSPALAQQFGWQDRSDRAARGAVGSAYYYGGYRACGSHCGRAARDFGQGTYDSVQRYSNDYGQRLQDYGSRLGDRYRTYRKNRRQ